MWYNALQGLVHNPSIPQQTSIINALHSLHPISYNVKSGVLFLYARNKPSNELEFHHFVPRLCLRGLPSSVADFATLEIHYFWPPQNLQRSKYIISGCRRFATARNTQRRAVADLQQPVAVFDAPPHRITLSWPPFPWVWGLVIPRGIVGQEGGGLL